MSLMQRIRSVLGFSAAPAGQLAIGYPLGLRKGRRPPMSGLTLVTFPGMLACWRTAALARPRHDHGSPQAAVAANGECGPPRPAAGRRYPIGQGAPNRRDPSSLARPPRPIAAARSNRCTASSARSALRPGALCRSGSGRTRCRCGRTRGV